MIKSIIILLYLFLINSVHLFAQDEYIHTKEGRSILNRRQMISNCLRSLHKDRTDKTASMVCECQVDKIDGHFTNKQHRKNSRGGTINIPGLLKEDTIFEKEIQECYTNTGKTLLIQAESFSDEFTADCVKNIQKSTEKKLDTNRVIDFCTCELALIKSKKISDAEIQNLSNPNSILFYEVMYKCGDPFSTKGSLETRNWNQNSEKDILGPLSDTLNILTLDGMTFVKVRIGSMTQFWLFDTGASDLLINNDMEATLKNENIIKETDYLGIGEYEMANGMVDTCRKYKIDNIRIGKFTINNIVVSVTDKGKRIIVGKGLLNKFSNWKLNNKDNTLILTK
ncbi:MAG: retropepsin-like aspartic protease [Ferruginibacter sp.]